MKSLLSMRRPVQILHVALQIEQRGRFVAWGRCRRTQLRLWALFCELDPPEWTRQGEPPQRNISIKLLGYPLRIEQTTHSQIHAAYAFIRIDVCRVHAVRGVVPLRLHACAQATWSMQCAGGQGRHKGTFSLLMSLGHLQVPEQPAPPPLAGSPRVRLARVPGG